MKAKDWEEPADCFFTNWDSYYTYNDCAKAMKWVTRWTHDCSVIPWSMFYSLGFHPANHPLNSNLPSFNLSSKLIHFPFFFLLSGKCSILGICCAFVIFGSVHWEFQGVFIFRSAGVNIHPSSKDTSSNQTCYWYGNFRGFFPGRTG